MAINLQFCSGGNNLEGFANYDMGVDIRQPLPFPDDHADFILIEHGLEHVNCAEGFRFLQEAHRILKPGGVLRVCVPKALEVPDDNHKIDLITGHGHQMIYDYHNLGDMIQLAGFPTVSCTERKDCDQHWKTIGMEKDDLESLRMEGVK